MSSANCRAKSSRLLTSYFLRFPPFSVEILTAPISNSHPQYVLGDTPQDTPQNTSGPKGPRGSCSWSGVLGPRGPQDQTKFEISSENEIFERATQRGPIFWWGNRDVEIEIFELKDQKFRSRLKISIEINFFLIVGPSGEGKWRATGGGAMGEARQARALPEPWRLSFEPRERKTASAAAHSAAPGAALFLGP